VEEEEIHHFFDVQNSHTRGTENLPWDLKANMVPPLLLRLRKIGAVTPNPHVFTARTGATLTLKNKSCGMRRRDVRTAVSAILKVRTAFAFEEKKLFFEACDPEGKGSTMLQNVGTYLPNSKISHPEDLNLQQTQMCET
jgi:hypothetical protein